MLELERFIMIQLGNRLGLVHEDTIAQSQRLDLLVWEKQKEVKW